MLHVTYITFGVHHFFGIAKCKNLWKTVNIFYNMPIHMFIYIVPLLQIEFTATCMKCSFQYFYNY